jgi:hypothetical protein
MPVRTKNEEINRKRMKSGKTVSAFCILHSLQQRHRSCRLDCRRTPKIPQMRRKSHLPFVSKSAKKRPPFTSNLYSTCCDVLISQKNSCQMSRIFLLSLSIAPNGAGANRICLEARQARNKRNINKQ